MGMKNEGKTVVHVLVRLRPMVGSIFQRSMRLFLALVVAFSGILLCIKVERAEAACPGVAPSCVHMLLFWDGGPGTAPSGWTDISSTYNDQFPRGDTVSNFGAAGSGGTTNHIPTVANVTTSAATAQAVTASGSNMASIGHTHPAASVAVTNGTPASNNNLPAYRTLQLIRYDGADGSGIPNTIPAGAIAIFDDSPGIPASGWTRLSAQDGKIVRINTTPGLTGGSDTHNYTLTWSGLGAVNSADAIGANTFLASAGFGAAANHTHAAPAPTTSATLSSLPPYITPLLAKASADTPTISVGFSAMFDGDPGGGWVVRSDSSGDPTNTTFYHQFLRPSTTWNGTSAGRDNETLPQATAITGPAIGTISSWAVGLGGGAAATHTHTLTAPFNNSTDVLPPYFGVVIAEKVNFILSDYRWYEDSGAPDVTDPWSVLNVAQDAPILTAPAAYNPPDITRQLRLRLRITVNGNSLATGVAKFKVQYKEGGTDASCTTGTWTDVDIAATGTGAWRYGSSTVPGHPNDGDPIPTSRLTPISNVLQQFIASSNSSANPNPVNIGQTMEYDFYLQDNTARGATHYYFRILENNGTLLSEYDVCPALSTKPQTPQQLRHGLFFIDGSIGAFSWAD
jgi:hypothetical protein